MILLVDDDADVRESLTECLLSSGHEVRTAENGRRALEHLRAGSRPDLILLDLRMPLLDGYEVLETLRASEHLSSIPVLIVSALRDVEPRALERTCGFLPKPVRMDRLIAAVDRVVPRH
jgi:CheY-like chemotaxis protein